MSYTSARQIIFCEKDPEFPEYPIHLGGSSVIASINGVMSLVTARHCLEEYLKKYNGSPRHCLAAIRNIGDQDFILFKNIAVVNDVKKLSHSYKTEFDLAICSALPSDNRISRDAIALVKDGNWAVDEFVKSGDEMQIYGFPDLCGPHIEGKHITYNPCCLTVTVDTAYDEYLYRGKIIDIEDRSGRKYSVQSGLNGLSGSPVFRPTSDTKECFSGIVVMGGSGYVYWLSSKYIAHFAVVKSA